MVDQLKLAAEKIPASIRKIILDKNCIDNAVSRIPQEGSPMEYLFDVYEEFVDISGEFDDFQCGQCREHVYQEFKKLKPYLIELEKNATG